MLSFSIIIPVKSFELTLNSNSLHLYRQKLGGGGWVSSTAADNIVPCTLNSLHFYRHKSGGNRSTVQQ